MRPKRAVLMVGVSLLFVPTALLAHHQLDAQFDTTKTITLTGSVERIDWRNPHVRLYLEVKDASNMVTWEVDMGSPSSPCLNHRFWGARTFMIKGSTLGALLVLDCAGMRNSSPQSA